MEIGRGSAQTIGLYDSTISCRNFIFNGFFSARSDAANNNKHEALFSHQEISPYVSGVRFAVHEVQK